MREQDVSDRYFATLTRPTDQLSWEFLREGGESCEKAYDKDLSISIHAVNHLRQLTRDCMQQLLPRDRARR